MIYRFQLWDLEALDENFHPHGGFQTEPQVGDEIVGDRGGMYRVIRRRHNFKNSPYAGECHELLFSLECFEQPPPKPAPVQHKSFFSFARMMRCL